MGLAATVSAVPPEGIRFWGKDGLLLNLSAFLMKALRLSALKRSL